MTWGGYELAAFELNSESLMHEAKKWEGYHNNNAYFKIFME